MRHDQDWRRNRDKVEKEISRSMLLAVCFGAAGLIAAMLQHEAVLVGEDPESNYINSLKAINSLSSVLLIFVIIR